MEHRWGRRLSTTIPVRLRCLNSRNTRCSCLGSVENLSASGALIRTESGIRPLPGIVVETLTPALGLSSLELPARIVREAPGEIAVEWTSFASTAVRAVLTENQLTGARSEHADRTRALGAARSCPLACAAAA